MAYGLKPRHKKLNLTDIATIQSEQEQTSITYKIDILIRHKIDNRNLLQHIDSCGVVELWSCLELNNKNGGLSHHFLSYQKGQIIADIA